MSVKLTNDDRCAVDLLLDRDQSGVCYSSSSSHSVSDRLTHVEKLLHLLDNLPEGEFPADLLGKTMSRCDQAADPRNRPSDPTQPAITAR